MTILKLKAGDQVTCPHCHETYPTSEGTVEDFVIPRKLGAESRANEECVYCDEWFSVARIADNEFEIYPGKG